jgi:hypothetical protein
MAQRLERLIYKCDLCDYTTNRSFNLNRHQNGKHVRACDNTRDCDKYVPCKTIHVPSKTIHVPIDSELIIAAPNFTITMEKS